MLEQFRNRFFEKRYTKRNWKLGASPLIFIFLFVTQKLNAQIHTNQDTTRGSTNISEAPSQADISTWAKTEKGAKHIPTSDEDKKKIKEAFLKTGTLPEGCRMYYGAVVCSGPTDGKPPEIYADISTRHSRSGSFPSFLDSLTGRENTRVAESEIRDAYNNWKKEDPKKAAEWIRNQPPYVEDRINFLNGIKITEGPELKEAFEDWKKKDPDAAAEWLKRRPHAKKMLL